MVASATPKPEVVAATCSDARGRTASRLSESTFHSSVSLAISASPREASRGRNLSEVCGRGESKVAGGGYSSEPWEDALKVAEAHAFGVHRWL